MTLPGSPPTSTSVPARMQKAFGGTTALLGTAIVSALCLEWLGVWAVVAWCALLLAIRLAARRGGLVEVPLQTDSLETVEGAELAPQIVPVWERNIQAANAHAERSNALLLESFGRITEHVDRVLGANGASAHLELSAIDSLVSGHKPLLDTLTATTREAVHLKDEMLQSVSAMTTELDEMVSLSKQVQNIARATSLLALNASVEAARADKTGASNAVAAEIRALAAQSREAGEGIARAVMKMKERMAAMRLEMRASSTSEPELLLRAEEDARAVIAALLDSVANVTRTSRTMRNASRQVQTDLERIYVGLQSQDRLNQMLTAVTADMKRFADWSQGNGDPAGTSARSWLDRLEATYPMEELRSSHHDTVVVEREAAVEFF